MAQRIDQILYRWVTRNGGTIIKQTANNHQKGLRGWIHIQARVKKRERSKQIYRKIDRESEIDR